MKNTAILCLASLTLGPLALSQSLPSAPERPPLLLVQEIPLPHVEGRIDHFTLDAKRKRVIGAALGNNTVEVVDIFAGRDVHSIPGAANPQGVAFAGELNKLFVANGADGKLRVYDGESFALLKTLDIGEDADNVRYDPAETESMSPMAGTTWAELPSSMPQPAHASTMPPNWMLIRNHF